MTNSGGASPPPPAGSVAVVGAGGYVGGRLVEHLSRNGVAVRSLTRRPRAWLDGGTVTVDLLAASSTELDDALGGATTVVHLAGHDEVVAARQPERALVETVTMTQRLAEAARRTGVQRVVHLSTVHVYGAQLRPGAHVSEATIPEPRAPYALARLTSEHLLKGILGDTAEVVSLRLTNSVGAPTSPDVDRWTLLVNDLCRQVVRIGTMTLKTSGQQARDWVSLADVCSAIAAAAQPHRLPAGTYNLGSGRSASVRDVAELVGDAWASVTGERPTLVAPEAEGPDPEPYRVDVSLLAAHGITSDTPLVTAIEEVVRFCEGHRQALVEQV
jgi:UDP-glucose 4-epimerase